MREIIIEEQDGRASFESLYVRRANYYETDKMGIIHIPIISAGLRRPDSTIWRRWDGLLRR